MPCYLECSPAALLSVSVRTLEMQNLKTERRGLGTHSGPLVKEALWKLVMMMIRLSMTQDPETGYFGNNTGKRFSCTWKLYQEGTVPVESEVNNLASVVLQNRRVFDTLAVNRVFMP